MSPPEPAQSSQQRQGPSVSVDVRSKPNFKSVINHRKGATHSIKVGANESYINSVT